MNDSPIKCYISFVLSMEVYDRIIIVKNILGKSNFKC